jgi:hypothetical protein
VLQILAFADILLAGYSLIETHAARATTLASTTFRTLMAITAKFDLETTQIDAVNVFVYCDLNEVIYIKLPLGFNRKKDKVLRLRKALYGL